MTEDDNKEDQVISRGDGSNGSGSSTNLNKNVAALLCYLATFVTGVIFLLLEKKNYFVRFHAMQSLVFFGGFWVLNIILNFVPLGSLLGSLLSLAGFIMWIVFMIKAYQGEYYKFPVVGQIAEDLLDKLK